MKSYEKYTELLDCDIIKLIRNGDETALEYIIEKYKTMVKIKSRSYFITGADYEDIIQEGMIGLYKAIRDFNFEKHSNFYSFAELCITRQLISAIKAANRQKHIPLNSSLSLNRAVYDENEECTYIEFISNEKITNPELLVIEQEEKLFIEKNIAHVLSSLESRVLSLYLKGKSYTEIAGIIEKDEKAIDNALQRIKKKVSKIIQDKNLTYHQKYDRV